MISFSKVPSYIGIIALVSSLIYLYRHGATIQSNLDSSEYWHSIKQTAENQVNHLKPQRQLWPVSCASTGVSLPSDHPVATANATPSKHCEAHISSTTCPELKPNLILSTIDGPRWQDQIFIFMQSLEIALGEESLQMHRSNSCPAAPVVVKIIVPQALFKALPPGFKALMKRYPSLEFVGALPDILDVPVVLRRFQGWSDFVNAHATQYDKVLACDLDVVFQRNPFAMVMKPESELLYFAEWRGLKIGQCSVHVSWFDQCASTDGGSFISKEQSDMYMHQDRICAGSVYGTSRAIKVYMDTMATQLKLSSYQCNDQAMHIHIYYSSLLDNKLQGQGIGKAQLVPNNEALFGSVGTTPLVTFNEWGDILNENGQVQHAVHQYKTHTILSDIVWRKYGWLAEIGLNDSIPAVPNLTEDTKPQYPLKAGHHEGYVSAEDNGLADSVHGLKHVRQKRKTGDGVSFKEYHLLNVSEDTCGRHSSLCSCKYADCQVHYESY